jgi:hypothetical protein
VILNGIEHIWGGDRQISLAPDFGQFSYSYTVLIVALVMFILTAKKDLSVFVKISKFGVIFAIINSLFVIGVGIYALNDSKVKFSIVGKSDRKPIKKDGVWNVQLALFGSNIGPIMGILGGGFYLHNMSLSIYRKSARPEKSVRDIWLAYTFVCLSYMICGTIGAIGF